MNTVLKQLLFASFIAMLTACATTDFYPYESRNNVQEGKGGTRFTTEGIDVWFNGEPPHKYAILGYIEDRRSVGIDESHKSIAADVLKKAKEVGADGLIEVVTQSLTNSSLGTEGFFGRRGLGFGIGFDAPLTAQISVKYTAVKYLD